MNQFDQAPVNGEAIEESIAIVCNGNTAPKAIAAGQYLFIKNHSTLATGGYHATDAIASGDTLSSSNVTSDPDGIANAINGKIPAVVNNLTSDSTTDALSAAQGKALNSKLPMLGNATSFGAGISPASDANFFRTYDSSGKYYQFYFSQNYFSVHHRNADDSEIWHNEYYYKWQYVTKKQGSGYVTLPSNANEYLFVITYATSSAEQSLVTSIVAPNDSSHVGTKNYTNGYYMSANSNGAFQVAVDPSNHIATLTMVTINGTSYLDYSYMYVYYR